MNRIFNSVSDLSAFNTLVIDGYRQQNIGELPEHLRADLKILTATLSEGMQIQYQRLCREGKKPNGDTPLRQAEIEYYMDLHRQQLNYIKDKDFQEAMKNCSFEKEGY